MTADLNAVVRSLAGPFAFCALGVSHRGARRFHLAGQFPATPDTFWRAASISKVVTARTALAAFQAAGVDAAITTAADILGFPLCGPDGGAPKRAPTLAQLASHQSGLWDDAGYLVPPDMALGDWIAAQGGAIWSGAAAGQRFEYCNLGYILLAACAEQAAGQRFAILAQDLVLGPMGVQAGYNWVGVPQGVSVLPTFRRDGADFVSQIDDPRHDAIAGTPAIHTARLSPQGGLRLSLAGALSLAEHLADGPTQALWRADPARTIGPPDLFQSYGWGVQILPHPSFYPRPLMGHFANAYGFCGGIWWDAQAQTAFAYAFNGLAVGDEDDALRPEECAIFDSVAQLTGQTL